MSKYTPLQRDLQTRPRVDMALTFEEIEKILGFNLPPSALEHNAWWANERGTHVQARAWMDAGWQVWHVRRSEKKVYFRPRNIEPGPPTPGVAESVALFVDDGSVIPVRTSSLRGSAIRLLEDYCEENGGNLANAIVGLLNSMALERRRQLVDWFRANAPSVPGDSSDLIREDRDAR